MNKQTINMESLEIIRRMSPVSMCSLGKDSMGMELILKEFDIPHRTVVSDTGWEADAWYDWLETVRERWIPGLEISRAEVDLDPELEPYALEVEAMLGRHSPMVRAILQHQMFPHRRVKFCSRQLKIEPTKELPWISILEHVLLTGIRWDESARRRTFPIVERDPSGFWTARPIIQWTLEDVLEIHRRHNVPLCPIYNTGVDRVGCWPCMPARNKAEIAALDPKRIAVIRRIEVIVGHLADERRRARMGDDMGEYETPTALNIIMPGSEGRSRCVPIDEAVSWAKTVYGGYQWPLFQPATDTCSRWGFCV